MIFRPQLARAVIDGRKTQTRRPVKGDQPCRYLVGHDYAVQPGYGKPAIGRVQILDVREERAGDISHYDARAEGFRTTDDFKEYWVRLHDKAWVERERIDLVAVYDTDVSIVTWILLRRFEQRHAHKRTWVITLTTHTDTPLYLAHPTPNSGDYTSQPCRAIDDLEVIDRTTQERYAKAASQRDAPMRNRKLQTFAEDLADARREQRNTRLAMFRSAA